MTDALIGYTGFVGGNLARQHEFDATFNSANIEQIEGRSFDLVVCAGAPAEKWKANADPDADFANIGRLIAALERVETEKLVLVSTVDVFARPIGVDENSEVKLTGLHAYGRNRRILEDAVAARFDATILRLPGLYGHGLKKNVIYDFLHDNQVSKIDSRGVFQFYGLDRLWADIEVALESELPLVHLATEPLSVAEMAREAFAMDFANEVSPAPAVYDMRTCYAPLFGGREHYIEDRARVIEGIADFVRSARTT